MCLCHPRTQSLHSPWPTVRKQAALGRSDLKFENIRLLFELHMFSWQTRGSIETLVFYFCSFPLFLKPTKIEPVTELSGVVRFVKPACAVRNEDWRYKVAADRYRGNSGFFMCERKCVFFSDELRLKPTLKNIAMHSFCKIILFSLNYEFFNILKFSRAQNLTF